jgi:peptidoglycan/xylan/chitin deacetylase (PgdA/CDA1 family)
LINRGKLLKNKLISGIVNIVICAIIVGVSLVGFAGSGSVVVSSDGEEAIYSAGESAKGVSLMFNVYQNTQNVLEMLDILDEYSAKATFFIGGSWADDNVDCVREIASRGHEIASHGYFHKDHSGLTYSENLEEIRTSVKLLNMITCGEVALFAPPYGAFNDSTLTACKSLNLKTIMWSRDTIDWRDDDVSLIYSRATDDLSIGEFVLMHPMDVTVKALPKVLRYCKEKGLQCVTVSNNLGY